MESENTIVIHTPDGTTWAWGGVSLFGRYITGDEFLPDGIYLIHAKNSEPFEVHFHIGNISYTLPHFNSIRSLSFPMPITIPAGQQLEFGREENGQFVPLGVLKCAERAD